MEAIAITRSIDIAAPRERVWKAMTNPKNLSKWHNPLLVEFNNLMVGEQIAFTYEGKTTYGTIATVEPPQQFGYRWQVHEDHEVYTRVTFRLDEVSGKTRVTVTEEGFEALPQDLRDKQIADNTEGWTTVLDRMAADLNESA